MRILIIGTPNSGKSQLAEDMVLKLADNRKRIYLATMLALDEDGRNRISRHRKMREGKGFVTVECPYSIDSLALDHDRVVLLECMSNLVGNEMYSQHNAAKGDDELLGLIVSEVTTLAARVADIVIVTNEFPLQDATYDEQTERYVKLLHRVNEALKAEVDEVITR